MKLFFDTETTGIVNFRAPAEDQSQPHLVQLGAILYDADNHVVAEINLIVKPVGFTIPPEAAAVHGITQERAERYGISLRGVLMIFGALVEKSELLVAHSLDFDRTVILAELFRLRQWESLLAVKHSFEDKPGFCTMRATTPICRLPSKFEGGDFKWPKLQEAYRHFFNEEFVGAHDAMADVRACARIFYALPAP